MVGSAGFRHGVVQQPRAIGSMPADVPGIVGAGVPRGITAADSWESVAGGAGRDRAAAELAAIGEALERYAAAGCAVPIRQRDDLDGAHVLDLEDFALFTPEQRRDPAFPHLPLYHGERTYTNVFSLHDNAEAWVPVGLVSLSAEQVAGVSTSSGLACARSPYQALLLALQEVIERDALMITWLHSIPGRRLPLDAAYSAPVEARGGSVICVDATPAYSVFPVALVAGSLPMRGHPRIALGAACRATWEEAVEKAYIEWTQGITFAGHHYARYPALRYRSYDAVKSFDDHAVYYTIHPEEWRKVPLLAGEPATEPPPAAHGATVEALLIEALDRLERHGIRVYYRDLTTVDLRQMGLTTVRVLSPDLTPIHFDHAFPFLGGRTADAVWRYPWTTRYRLRFPNPLPHPLG